MVQTHTKHTLTLCERLDCCWLLAQNNLLWTHGRKRQKTKNNIGTIMAKFCSLLFGLVVTQNKQHFSLFVSSPQLTETRGRIDTISLSLAFSSTWVLNHSCYPWWKVLHKNTHPEKIFQLSIIMYPLIFLRNQLCAYWWSAQGSCSPRGNRETIFKPVLGAIQCTHSGAILPTVESRLVRLYQLWSKSDAVLQRVCKLF